MQDNIFQFAKLGSVKTKDGCFSWTENWGQRNNILGISLLQQIWY